jgi:hypothetical protein
MEREKEVIERVTPLPYLVANAFSAFQSWPSLHIYTLSLLPDCGMKPANPYISYRTGL